MVERIEKGVSQFMQKVRCRGWSEEMCESWESGVMIFGDFGACSEITWENLFVKGK